MSQTKRSAFLAATALLERVDHELSGEEEQGPRSRKRKRRPASNARRDDAFPSSGPSRPRPGRERARGYSEAKESAGVMRVMKQLMALYKGLLDPSGEQVVAGRTSSGQESEEQVMMMTLPSRKRPQLAPGFSPHAPRKDWEEADDEEPCLDEDEQWGTGVEDERSEDEEDESQQIERGLTLKRTWNGEATSAERRLPRADGDDDQHRPNGEFLASCFEVGDDGDHFLCPPRHQDGMDQDTEEEEVFGLGPFIKPDDDGGEGEEPDCFDSASASFPLISLPDECRTLTLNGPTVAESASMLIPDQPLEPGSVWRSAFDYASFGLDLNQDGYCCAPPSWEDVPKQGQHSDVWLATPNSYLSCRESAIKQLRCEEQLSDGEQLPCGNFLSPQAEDGTDLCELFLV